MKGHSASDRKYLRLKKAYERTISRSRETHRHLISLFENLPVGVIVLNMAGRVVFFNRESHKILGFKASEVSGAHFRMFLSLDDISEGFRMVYEAIKGHFPQKTILRLLKRDRGTMIAEVEIGPFKLDKKLNGAILFLRDVSQRKKIEDLNRKRVQSFMEFSKELEEWQGQVLALKKEVNNLLVSLGKKEKYPLVEN